MSQAHIIRFSVVLKVVSLAVDELVKTRSLQVIKAKDIAKLASQYGKHQAVSVEVAMELIDGGSLIKQIRGMEWLK